MTSWSIFEVTFAFVSLKEKQSSEFSSAYDVRDTMEPAEADTGDVMEADHNAWIKCLAYWMTNIQLRHRIKKLNEFCKTSFSIYIE